MTNYKVLESSQRRIYTAMRFDDAFLRSVDPQTFNEQVILDSTRNDFLVEPGQNIDDLRRNVFKERQDRGYFTQSDYEGGAFLTALYLGDNCSQKRDSDSEYIQKGSFGYIDIEGKVCGLTIYRVKEAPPKYAISFVRNADADILEDRQTTIIYDAGLLGVLGLEPFDTTSEATYPEGATQQEEAAAGNNELKEDIVPAQNLKEYLIKLLNSDTAQMIVESLFVSKDTLNPDAIEHLPKIILLYKFLDDAVIPAEGSETTFTLYGREVSTRRVNIQNAARAKPKEFFNEDNFKSNLINIIQMASPGAKQNLQLEYIKYCVKKNGFEEELSLDNIDNSESLKNVIFAECCKKASEEVVGTDEMSADIKNRNTNRYYILYLECLAMDAPDRSERKRIFRKIKQISDNLTEENKELAELVAVHSDLQTALRIARDPDTRLNFDPQGRLLVDTGKSIVSIDIAGYPDLQDKYNQQIKYLLLERDGIEKVEADAILNSLNDLKSKNSIIFLQQELHFHLMLSLRLYERQFGEKYAHGDIELHKFYDFAEIHAATMAEVNQSVMQAFVDGLVQARATGKLRDINKVLNAARARIISDAHDILLEKVMTNHPDIDLSKYNKSQTERDAKHTTATDKRILHQDENLATVTEIEGSCVTSHDRTMGSRFAHRGIKRYRYDPENGVTYPLSGNKVRSPSLPAKKGFFEQQYIDDTVTKISELEKDYNFKNPFTYNLLTAMNDFLGDTGGNLQSQSARHIILGAHAYNRGVKSSKQNNFCLIQAISVNGFGRPLGYRTYGAFMRPLADEATLLTEMTLCHNIDPDLRSLICYKDFLSQSQPPEGFFAKIASFFTSTKYFVKSTFGKELREGIAAKKLVWQKVQDVDPDDYVALARASLQKIMAYDLHYSHDYAKIIQALSLFLEEDAVFGCKSGNERTPIIDERGQIMEQPQLPDYLVAAFVGLSRATNEQAAQDMAHLLKGAIDRCYNDENVYGSTALIPLVDQGAGHKISQAKTLAISRNNAEEPTVDNLVQGNVRDMQAHVGLPTFVSQAVERRIKLGVVLKSDSHDEPVINSSHAAVINNLGGVNGLKRNVYTQLDATATDDETTSVDSNVSQQNNVDSKLEIDTEYGNNRVDPNSSPRINNR